jgi:hypothetical protein
LSQSNKELAAWYAKLNAADCWGQQILVAEQQQPKEQQPILEQSPLLSPSPFVKTTAPMPTRATTSSSSSSLPATGTGYRMAADGANKENKL